MISGAKNILDKKHRYYGYKVIDKKLLVPKCGIMRKTHRMAVAIVCIISVCEATFYSDCGL